MGHCVDCGGDFCTLCKLSICEMKYEKDTGKDYVKAENITKCKEEESSVGSISSVGAEGTGSARFAFKPSSKPSTDISVKLDPDWKPGSSSKILKKKIRKKKKKCS